MSRYSSSIAILSVLLCLPALVASRNVAKAPKTLLTVPPGYSTDAVFEADGLILFWSFGGSKIIAFVQKTGHEAWRSEKLLPPGMEGNNWAKPSLASTGGTIGLSCSFRGSDYRHTLLIGLDRRNGSLKFQKLYLGEAPDHLLCSDGEFLLLTAFTKATLHIVNGRDGSEVGSLNAGEATSDQLKSLVPLTLKRDLSFGQMVLSHGKLESFDSAPKGVPSDVICMAKGYGANYHFEDFMDVGSQRALLGFAVLQKDVAENGLTH